MILDNVGLAEYPRIGLIVLTRARSMKTRLWMLASHQPRKRTCEVPTRTSLQSGTVYDLIVDSEFATAIVDDQNTNTTTAIGEGLVKS